MSQLALLVFCTLMCVPHSRRASEGMISLHSGELDANMTKLLLAAHDRVTAQDCPEKPTVTDAVLAMQNSVTSATVICAFQDDAAFKEASALMTKQVMQRDNADGEKLSKGIQLAIDKKVLPANPGTASVFDISVEGKTAEEVANIIVEKLGDAPNDGCVMTLQGLSGTGKGTTLGVLKTKLPNAQTWSNGNIFRSLTLLAATYAENNKVDLKEALTKENLQQFVGMLEFGEFNGDFDVKIDGLGLNYMISDIETSVLKSQKVRTNIPSVAEVTQGEVINFVKDAMAKLTAAGKNVLIEGREQTLNYIPTPHRFALTFKNLDVIGQRRVAQIMGGKAKDALDLDALHTLPPEESSAAIMKKLKDVLNDDILVNARAQAQNDKGTKKKAQKNKKDAERRRRRR